MFACFHCKDSIKGLLKSIAEDEAGDWFGKIRTFGKEHRQVLIYSLAVICILIGLGVMLIHGLALHVERLTVYLVMGFAAGVLGVLVGAVSVMYIPDAFNEVFSAGLRACLPFHLRKMVDVFLCAVMTAGLLTATISVAVSEVLVLQWGNHFDWSRLGIMAVFNLLLCCLVGLRNHFKTRGDGGWALAEDTWFHRKDPDGDGAAAIRALL